jgi:hypothetical protein
MLIAFRYSGIVAILIAVVLAGCGDVLSRMESKHKALGTTNEVVFVCDESVWESFVGDTVVYYFEAPYPIMPQPEPIFDIRHFTPEELNAAPLRKELRTYVMLSNLSDTTSATTRMISADMGEEKLRRAREDMGYFTSVGKDKWANGQLLIYVFAFDLHHLATNLVKAFPAIASKVNEHDLVQIDAATYLHREAVAIGTRIQEKFGVGLKIPGDYKIALDNENFIWIRQDVADAISNIMMMRFPYRDTSQLNLEGIIGMRDRMGVMIEGSSPGSFMVTNAVDLPVYLYRKTLDGHYTVEGRGTWELTEDFLGGPFVTHAIVDGDSVLIIDAFVHAPGRDKRNYVQRLDHIVTSLRF